MEFHHIKKPASDGFKNLAQELVNYNRIMECEVFFGLSSYSQVLDKRKIEVD